MQEQYRYIVLAERTGKLGLDRMNLQTRQAIDLSACGGGEFDDWSIGEIDDSPETAAEVEQ